MTNISPNPLHIFCGSYMSGFTKYLSCQFHIAILFSCVLHLTTFLGSGQVVHHLSVKTDEKRSKTTNNLTITITRLIALSLKPEFPDGLISGPFPEGNHFRFKSVPTNHEGVIGNNSERPHITRFNFY